MKIDKDTKICVSIASQPGNFGATVHNYCYEKLGLNYVYLPLSTNDLRSTIEWIKDTPNVVGCSVSMPYKNKVLKYMDEVDSYTFGNINTITKRDDKLIGHSTDVFAIEEILKDKKFDFVCILGDGAMSDNFYNILKNKSHSITVLTHHAIKKYEHDMKYDLVVNATPVGMNRTKFENKEIYDLIYDADIFIDCPVNSSFEINILQPKKEYISGVSLSLLQASKQFELYTGMKQEEVYPLMKEAINVRTT